MAELNVMQVCWKCQQLLLEFSVDFHNTSRILLSPFESGHISGHILLGLRSNLFFQSSSPLLSGQIYTGTRNMVQKITHKHD